MQGYLASDHFDRAEEIATTMSAWIRSGQLRDREEVAPRLEDAPGGPMARMLAGESLGKSVVRVAHSDAEQE